MWVLITKYVPFTSGSHSTKIMYLPTEGKAPSKKKLTDAAKYWSRQSHVFFEAKTSIRFAVSMEESIVNTKSS